MVYGNVPNYKSLGQFQTGRLEAKNNINNWSNIPKTEIKFEDPDYQVANISRCNQR